MARPTLEASLRSAVIAALAGDRTLAAMLNRVGDGEGELAPVPYAVVGDAQSSEWGAKDRPGAEVRCVVMIADRGDSTRLAEASSAIERIIAELPRRLDDWDTSGVVVLSRRVTRRRDGLRQSIIELRCRGW